MGAASNGITRCSGSSNAAARSPIGPADAAAPEPRRPFPARGGGPPRCRQLRRHPADPPTTARPSQPLMPGARAPRPNPDRTVDGAHPTADTHRRAPDVRRKVDLPAGSVEPALMLISFRAAGQAVPDPEVALAGRLHHQPDVPILAGLPAVGTVLLGRLLGELGYDLNPCADTVPRRVCTGTHSLASRGLAERGRNVQAVTDRAQ